MYPPVKEKQKPSQYRQIEQLKVTWRTRERDEPKTKKRRKRKKWGSMTSVCTYCFNIPPLNLGGRNNDPRESNRGVHKKKKTRMEVEQ